MTQDRIYRITTFFFLGILLVFGAYLVGKSRTYASVKGVPSAPPHFFSRASAVGEVVKFPYYLTSFNLYQFYRSDAGGGTYNYYGFDLIDFNGDGLLDLFGLSFYISSSSSNVTLNNLYIYANKGDGTVENVYSTTVKTYNKDTADGMPLIERALVDYVYGATLARIGTQSAGVLLDVNGDGLTDIAVGNDTLLKSKTEDSIVYLNKGNLDFSIINECHRNSGDPQCS